MKKFLLIFTNIILFASDTKALLVGLHKSASFKEIRATGQQVQLISNKARSTTAPQTMRPISICLCCFCKAHNFNLPANTPICGHWLIFPMDP